ncbi:MAG: GldG family protein [Elusimicrobia bacterium]|nr:GldG family protein [Elusimicrobiota bacterium]
MSLPAHNQRQFRLSLLSGTGVLLVLGALIFANLLGNHFFARWDWTSGGRYSLSQASVDLVNGLEDPVFIRLYLSPGLPQPYESQGRYIQDLLNEWRSSSRGKISLETIAPNGSDEMDREFRRLNIQPGRFTQESADQFQVREGYIAMVIHYQDKQDIIPFVQDVNTLEYELASRIRVMSQEKKKTLFFISNHNEVSPNFIKEGPAGRLFEEFHVEPTQLSTLDSGLTPDAIFLLGPQSKLSEEELSVLDTYVSSGIPLVVALNRRVVFPQNFRSMAQDTGLESFLEHYGIRVEREFVMDNQCRNIGMQSKGSAFLVKYFPFIMADALQRENQALKGIDVLSFPFASALTSTLGSPSTLTFTWMARSSPNSWVWPGFYNVDPPNIQKQMESEPPTSFKRVGRDKDLGPFTLAALVEGSTVSFREPQQPAPQIKLVVIGTSFFANPQIPNAPGNPLFLLSLARWLTQDGNYLSIPPKSSPFRPLKPVPPWGRPLIKVVGYFFVPFLVILAGFLHWQNRVRTREKIHGIYSRREIPPNA